MGWEEEGAEVKGRDLGTKTTQGGFRDTRVISFPRRRGWRHRRVLVSSAAFGSELFRFLLMSIS